MVKGNNELDKISRYIFMYSFLSIPLTGIISGVLAFYLNPLWVFLIVLNVLGCGVGLGLKERVDGGYGD